MSKSSHTPEFRAMVAQEYLDGLGSYDSLATKYQIGCTQFREWVAKYKQHGLPADKYCIEHNRNYKDTASLYDVSYSQVYSWVKKYDAEGEEGLSDKRGHHKTDGEVDELERLRRENLRLKRQLEEKDMVVELLKKVKEFEGM